MKKMKKNLGRLPALLMVLVLVFAMLPVQADALVRNGIPVFCATMDSNGKIDDLVSGVPVISGGNTYVITDDDFYQSGDTCVAIFGEDTVVQMSYTGSVEGIALFSFSHSDKSVCVYEGQGVVGEKCTLQAFSPDGKIHSYDAVVTGCDEAPTEAGFIMLDVSTSMNMSDVVLPAALLDSSGDLVAIVCDGKYYGFAVPVGAAGGGSGNGGSNNDGGSSSGGNDDSGETAPARPAPTEPAPVQTEPPATQPPVTEPKPDNQNYLLFILGGVAVAALAAVVVLLLRKPKPQPPVQPVIYTPEKPAEWKPAEGSVTRPGPQPGVTVPANNTPVNVPGWETVPASGMSLTDTGGYLGGRTFSIPQTGMLIGRATNADIQYPVETKGVSRNHCRIYWEGGNLMLVDNGSTSGTYVLGKGQLRANTPVQIKEGDVICLGAKKISLTVKKN